MTSLIFRPDQSCYELEYKLGEGLNSVVWRATRLDFSGETRRTVALKLPKEQTSVSFLRREFETLQRVNSIYCARVIAWESFGEQSALALEWIDGITLLELAQKISLSVIVCDEIVRQIYLGLQDLRSADLFHGDLHPSNVMIDRDGRVRLIDFASGRTADGRMQATPAFVAPEIWLGQDFSFEADLFALGVIGQHLKDGFRNLPTSTLPSNSRDLLRANPSARRYDLEHDLERSHASAIAQSQLAAAVARVQASPNFVGTELVDPASFRKVPSRPKSPALFRIALGLSLIMAATLPVRAEAPAESLTQAAGLIVRSENWVQLSVNGKAAGFAPLVITNLRPGNHRISWKSASGAGEWRFQVKAGDVVRLAESRTRRGQLEVR